MQQPKTSYLDWLQRFSTQQACLEELARHRWPSGFMCPRCGHDQGCWTSTRGLHQCSRCRYHSSVSAGTLFHHTRVALPKWFAAVYLMSADKGGISALRLSQADRGLVADGAPYAAPASPSHGRSGRHLSTRWPGGV